MPAASRGALVDVDRSNLDDNPPCRHDYPSVTGDRIDRLLNDLERHRASHIGRGDHHCDWQVAVGVGCRGLELLAQFARGDADDRPCSDFALELSRQARTGLRQAVRSRDR